MKILIAGGTGFIGQHLSQSLFEKGNEVYILTRNVEKAKIRNINYNYISWDNHNEIIRVIELCEAVINLAGENIGDKPWTEKQRQRIISSRIDTTKILADLCKKANKSPDIFIQASAIGYYGYNSKEAKNENSPKGPGFLADVVDKWENVIRENTEIADRCIFLRTGVVLAESYGFLKKLKPIIDFGMKAYFGRGNQFLSWIHIEDEINAIIHLLHSQESHGVYNLVAPGPVTMKNFADTYASMLSRWTFGFIPEFPIKLIFGQMAKEVILSNIQVYPFRLLEEGFHFTYKTIEQSLQNIVVHINS